MLGFRSGLSTSVKNYGSASSRAALFINECQKDETKEEKNEETAHSAEDQKNQTNKTRGGGGNQDTAILQGDQTDAVSPDDPTSAQGSQKSPHLHLVFLPSGVPTAMLPFGQTGFKANDYTNKAISASNWK